MNVFVAQKNGLIETVLLSAHNICFHWEIRKLTLSYAFLNKGLIIFKFTASQVAQFHYNYGLIVWMKNSVDPDNWLHQSLANVIKQEGLRPWVAHLKMAFRLGSKHFSYNFFINLQFIHMEMFIAPRSHRQLMNAKIEIQQ